MSQRVYTADEVTVIVNPDKVPIEVKLSAARGFGDCVVTIPVEDLERYPWGACPRCRRTGLLGEICKDCSPP